VTESEFNLEERILCEDGACIGLVGRDGRCRVCGLTYSGDLSAFDGQRETSTEDSAARAEVTSQSEMVVGDDDSVDVNDRICCPDDTCIGIIGANGRCGTCGRAG